MIPTHSLQEIQQSIDNILGEKTRQVAQRVRVPEYTLVVPYPPAPRFTTEVVEEHTEQWSKLVGLLFCLPSSKTGKDEILPNLDYFHYRSGHFVDFYCVGYGTDPGTGPEESRAAPVSLVNNVEWRFSAKDFNNGRAEVEGLTKWRYSGETDLLLAAARKPRDGEATLDYSCALACNLEQMLRDEAISSVRAFFEMLCQFGEQFSGSDPVWEFSDKLGVDSLKGLLVDEILSLLPEVVRKRYKAAKHFAISNVAL